MPVASTNMRPFLQPCSQSLRLFTRPVLSHSKQIARVSIANMSTGVPPSSGLDIATKHITTAPGIKLSSEQETIVGSVLDLFAGKPTLQKLALWRDDATFVDPITIAEGRDRYAAQWYGLEAAFSEIDQINHQVKDAGNPILLDLRSKYVIKGINKEQLIQSEVAIHLDEQGKIKKVEDKWNGKLPDGPISNAFRHLNAFTVPKFVSVPKNAEEEAQRNKQ
ncbi:hypothetical protein ACN47E_000085 [Coniothyrium glycines]